MKKIILFLVATILLFSCDEESTPSLNGPIKDLKFKVKFGDAGKSIASKDEVLMTAETPMDYYIALKSLTLVGSGETEDYEVFNNTTLAASEVYEFNDESPLSVLQGEDIPEGTFSAIKMEIYYLQMRITIALNDPGDRDPIEHRNFRIYMSDDAEYEQGLHQPGDMTQINDGVGEIGWLLGEAQDPNLDPVSPRISAYTYNGDGTSWYNFNGKSGENYGPFGDVSFWNNVSQPIYEQLVPFNIESAKGKTMIVEFDVTGCWKFQDKDGNGSFGYGDLDAVIATKWQMDLPQINVSYQ